MAEEVGFEPTEPCGSPVFKTGALDRSATPPLSVNERATRIWVRRNNFNWHFRPVGEKPLIPGMNGLHAVAPPCNLYP